MFSHILLSNHNNIFKVIPSSFYIIHSFNKNINLIASISTTKMASNNKTIYDFEAKDIDGYDTKLNKYKGRVVLIVNVASECGFTKTNYPQMKDLLEKYKD
ncbi:Glutathione peroxidase [Meloidogyne graminicola]|uniref:Glutathione peroxidase n=1 Tax=Meloidogyne graminicola TaxID=189291 RepID=A0A8S9ZL15_9BILA|nr:Glutathione peroxidase [Meloidogyne graminicola]